MKTEELKAIAKFLWKKIPDVPFLRKLKLVRTVIKISREVDCPHTNQEMLSFIESTLRLPGDMKGCIVEAGCYKGGSSAKFSLAAGFTGRELIIFDSFQGLPDHNEPHEKTIFGKPVTFTCGEYCGTLEEVQANIKKYGNIDACNFREGWFEQTLPSFKGPIAAAYIDVDLAASVKTCLKYLYPLIEQGGYLYCQDGHLPLVVDVFDDKNFWMNEVGVEKPFVHGLGKQKLIKIIKD